MDWQRAWMPSNSLSPCLDHEWCNTAAHRSTKRNCSSLQQHLAQTPLGLSSADGRVQAVYFQWKAASKDVSRLNTRDFLCSALAQHGTPSSSIAELAKWGSEPGLSQLSLSDALSGAVFWKHVQLASCSLRYMLQVVRDHGEQALLSQFRAREAMEGERERGCMTTLLKQSRPFHSRRQTRHTFYKSGALATK